MSLFDVGIMEGGQDIQEPENNVFFCFLNILPLSVRSVTRGVFYGVSQKSWKEKGWGAMYP